MKIPFLKIAKIFFGIALFTIPFQVNTIFYDANAYSSGMFLPYSAFLLYFSDFCFLISTLCFGIDFIQKKKMPRIGHSWVAYGLFIFFVFYEISVFQATDQMIAGLHLLRFLELIVVYLLIVNRILSLPKIITILSVSFGFQCLLIIFQSVFQSPLGLHFLGEPYFSVDTPGIAKLDIGDSKWVRPYGTLPHPNVLAGILYLLFFLIGFCKKAKYLPYLRVLFFIGIVLTFSRSVFLALFLGILFFIFFLRSDYQPTHKLVKNVLVLSALLFVLYFFIPLQSLVDQSMQHRIWYMEIASHIIKSNFWGTGSGNFTLLMPYFSEIKMYPWEIQPVHNVYLLITAELGFIAAAFIVVYLLGIFYQLWLKRYFKEVKVLLTIFVGITVVLFHTDHYFWDIYAGQMLLFIFIGIVSTFLEKVGTKEQLQLF